MDPHAQELVRLMLRAYDLHELAVALRKLEATPFDQRCQAEADAIRAMGAVVADRTLLLAHGLNDAIVKARWASDGATPPTTRPVH